MSSVVLSGSKLNVFSKCSWIYYATYILGIRSEGNSGSQRGSVVHVVFDCLLSKRRKKYVDKILNDKTIKNCLPVLKLVQRLSEKNNLGEIDNKDQNNLDLIDSMIVTGLGLDFYCEGGNLEKAETQFSYKGDGYEIRGAIDKIAKYDENYKIFDYKSSSNKYKGEESEFNEQSLIYSLWFYRLYGVIPFFRFIFLRFEGDPFIDKYYTENEIKGFEEYLIYITKYLEDFDLKKGMSNMAADKGYPKDGSFSGLTSCGYAKYPGHVSTKTGKEYWACSYKFKKTYYYIFDDKQEVKYVTDKPEKITEEEWKNVKTMEYAGCPAWNRDKYDFVK